MINITTPLKTLPKIIFFDIDETLYLKHSNSVPDSVFEALKLLKQKGILIAIATGRSQGIFPKSIIKLINEIDVDILVTINGQYVSFHGQTLVHFPLSYAQIMATSDYLASQHIGYAYMTANKIWALSQTKALDNALSSLHIDYQPISRANFDYSQAIYQMLAFYENNQNISLELPSLRTTRWHISGVDILDKDGSKARGIGAVLDKLNIDKADAWAVGDGLNDIEMLEMVGFGIAMGNAHDTLKAMADFVAPNASDDGIYQAFKQLGVI